MPQAGKQKGVLYLVPCDVKLKGADRYASQIDANSCFLHACRVFFC